MTKMKRAGSVVAENRPERDPKACESLILRPPESTRQGGGDCSALSDVTTRPPRRPFPRTSLRRFTGWPEGLLVLFEAGWHLPRARRAA